MRFGAGRHKRQRGKAAGIGGAKIAEGWSAVCGENKTTENTVNVWGQWLWFHSCILLT